MAPPRRPFTLSFLLCIVLRRGTMNKLPQPQFTHLADVYQRPGFLRRWERVRHKEAHWFVECMAEFVSVFDWDLRTKADFECIRLPCSCIALLVSPSRLCKATLANVLHPR